MKVKVISVLFVAVFLTGCGAVSNQKMKDPDNQDRYLENVLPPDRFQKFRDEELWDLSFFTLSRQLILLKMNTKCLYSLENWKDNHDRIQHAWLKENKNYLSFAEMWVEDSVKEVRKNEGSEEAKKYRTNINFEIDKWSLANVKRYAVSRKPLIQQCETFMKESLSGRFDIKSSPGDLFDFSYLIDKIKNPYRSYQFRNNCKERYQTNDQNIAGLWYVMIGHKKYIKFYLNEDGSYLFDTFVDYKLRNTVTGTWSLDNNKLKLMQDGKVTKTDQIEFITCNEMVGYTNKGRRINYLRRHPFGY